MLPEGKKVRVYRKCSNGISTWDIWWEGSTIFYASALVEGGAQQVRREIVELNKSGRTLDQQIYLQMHSRLSRMLDKGYKSSREEALAGATNQLGLVNPMLAHPITKVSVPPLSSTRAFVQGKYDGHRTLITRFEGKMFAYTRRGKPVTSIGHILSVLDLPEGATIDGELYCHGKSLQSISSLIKREQGDSKLLCYHAYDVVEKDVFSERLRYLKELVPGHPSVFVVPTTEVTSMDEVYSWFKRHREQALEGTMLRLDLRGYEDGKRSDQLLKVKEREDEDFEVTDVKPGKDGVGILVLKLNDRPGTFDCLAPGSVPTKQKILAEKQNYIGRFVTVLFANKTSDGIPFHGVADRFVEEI